MGGVGMKLIEVKSYDIKIPIDGNCISIIGPESSGKTYLLKKLINKVDNNDIYIDNVCIKDYDIKYLRNNIFVVLNDDVFKCTYVAEELFYYLNVLGYDLDEITNRINDFSKIFKIKNIQNQKINSLPLEIRIYIKILSMLITNPKIIGIDNLFPYLTNEHIKLIMKYIKKNNITLLNIINDGAYLKYTQKVIVINENKCVLNTTVEDALSGNSILPYIGISLPFSVELSANLILYGLVDKIYLDEGALVNKLWH
jgi:subfamily B ATP-binding cassette protein MsbA